VIGIIGAAINDLTRRDDRSAEKVHDTRPRVYMTGSAQRPLE